MIYTSVNLKNLRCTFALSTIALIAKSPTSVACRTVSKLWRLRIRHGPKTCCANHALGGHSALDKTCVLSMVMSSLTSSACTAVQSDFLSAAKDAITFALPVIMI